MTNTVDIQNKANYPIDEIRLKQAVKYVLEQHNVSANTNLSIVFTDVIEIQKLNQQYRQIDAPTDVLSFPAEPLPEYLEDDSSYLGDLIIAYPYAVAQAEKHQHDLSDSLCLLVIHGTLHLLGYDHDSFENRAQMWAVQAEILKMMDIDTHIVPSLEEYPHD